MAQIAIPLILLGSAYLACNDNSGKEDQEGFSEITDKSTNGNLLAEESDNYVANNGQSSLSLNNEETLTSHHDKYFLRRTRQEPVVQEDQQRTFTTLAGTQINESDVRHNNMTIFYNNRTNGNGTNENSSILDSYTGQGTFDIKKEEISSLFKPESNIQNVYGNQNTNDFYQSRMNQSLRHANTKPFESIQVTPGVGLNYTENSTLGFNTESMSRDSWRPKTVDELRAVNNPKLTFRMDDHMGPALQPVQNRGIQGKIVKRTQESFFQNDNNLGMVASSATTKASMNRSEQELNEQNRDTTTVSYYGVKGSGEENVSYVNGQFSEPHRQQLSTNPMINFSNNAEHPTNTQCYGKESVTALPNNRSTTHSNYFGSVRKLISNVVQPVVNGLRHSKKTNFNENQDTVGNVSGVTFKARVTNPYDNIQPTNREMYECKLGMNHLNMQHQDSTAYMNTRPILENTQRASMNQSETGPAMSTAGVTAPKNYDNVYRQRNNNKLYASDVKSGGNMNVFNNNITMRTTNTEKCNERMTPLYNPQYINNYNHPTELIGQFSTMPQEYSNDRTESQIDTTMIEAFKRNPYTQPLNSVA